jgi:hypothetical protein
MCSTSIARLRQGEQGWGMHHQRLGRVPLVLVISMALPGLGALSCAGGQTGDGGTDGGEGCIETEWRDTTLERAEAAGIPVSLTLSELQDGRTEPGQLLRFTLPPSVWQAKGREPPADRSALGRLVIGDAKKFVASFSIPTSRCTDEELEQLSSADEPRAVDVTFDYTIRIPDLDQEWSGEGLLGLTSFGRPPSASLLLDLGHSKPGSCTLRDPGVDGGLTKAAEIDCHELAVAATPTCLEPADFSSLPAVPGTDLTMQDLVALANAQSPIELACCDGSTLSVPFELKLPEAYCQSGPFQGQVPGSVALTAERFGFAPDVWNATLFSSSASGLCDETVDTLGACKPAPGGPKGEAAFEALPVCAGFGASVRDGLSNQHDASFSIRFDEAQAMSLVVSVGDQGNDGPYPRCLGQLKL